MAKRRNPECCVDHHRANRACNGPRLLATNVRSIATEAPYRCCVSTFLCVIFKRQVGRIGARSGRTKIATLCTHLVRVLALMSLIETSQCTEKPGMSPPGTEETRNLDHI